jgi:hypothetical protein
VEGVTPTGFFFVVVFVGVAAFLAVDVVAVFVVPEVAGFVAVDLEPEVFAVVEVFLDAGFDAFAPDVVVAGVVVAAGVVVVAALCAAVSAESSLPHPANTRASRIPVVAVSFRGTARTIAPCGERRAPN